MPVLFASGSSPRHSKCSSRLARVSGAAPPFPTRTTGSPRLLGEVFIEFQKHSVKTDIIQNRLIQRNRLLHFGRDRRQRNPPRKIHASFLRGSPSFYRF